MIGKIAPIIYPSRGAIMIGKIAPGTILPIIFAPIIYPS